MSNWNDKLQKLTNEAINESTQHTKLLAERIIKDIEKADHEEVAYILRNTLEIVAEEAAKSGKTSVDCTVPLYEIKRLYPNLWDIMGYWTGVLRVKLFYGGYYAEGVYEGTTTEIYRHKMKFNFNPKIYRNQTAFAQLRALILEELTPHLVEILPENAQVDFPKNSGYKIEIHMRLHW